MVGSVGQQCGARGRHQRADSPSFMSGMMGVARMTSPLTQTILSISAIEAHSISKVPLSSYRAASAPWGLRSRMLVLRRPPPNGRTLKTAASICSALCVFSAR